MKLTKSWESKKQEPFNASMLKIGEIMECDCKTYGIIVRGISVLFSLTNCHYWSDPNNCDLSGRKLSKGESITLTQE